MNYETAYKETLEQLYLLEARLASYEKQEERLDMLFAFQKVLDGFISQNAVGILPFETSRLETLLQAFNAYGSFYFGELAARREVFNKNKELLAAYEAIRTLKAKNESLENQIEFQTK